MNRISPAPTEASVTSPEPRTISSRTPRETRATNTTLRNTDSPLTPTIKSEQLRRAMATAPTGPAAPRTQPAAQEAPAPEKPGAFKKLLMAGGALMASVGVVAGLLSIVALGPVGLAVAAGAAALGAAMIWLGGKSS